MLRFAVPCLLVALGSSAWSQTKPPAADRTVELWPGAPPEESGTIGPEYVRMSPELTPDQVEVTKSTRMLTNVTKPTLTFHRPDPKLDTGTSMLVCPGGGYWDLYWELEGEEVAKWLASQGITGIILKYRVPRRPDDPRGEPARRPLQDAQRAVSLVRSRAAEWELNPDRIGLIGFSAGGHLAIATATSFDRRSYAPVDDIDKVSCRPDFAVAAYSGYLKAKDSLELAPGLRIPEKTPPIFLVHGSNDPISPPSHSVAMYLALQKAGVPAELHIYASTTHDFGIRAADRPYGRWTEACTRWLTDQKLLTPKLTKAAAIPAVVLDRWLAKPILDQRVARTMIPEFLESQLKPLPLPATRETWEKEREGLRRRVLKTVGLDDLVPAKWDLHLTQRGTLHRDGYRIEKLTYETYPGKAIAALLYVPEGVKGRVPGVVSISGHSPLSKAADYVQRRNVNLVLRGCIVLSYDYFGYGESKTGDDPQRPRGGNGHELKSFSFSRRTATALEILDAVRAVDVLAGRPEVDPEKIGFTGESGGSNSTYWISAIDPRVRLAAPVCSVTTFDYWIRTDVNWDWHQRPFGIRAFADIGTLLALHAPRPLVIISSRRRTDDGEFPLEEAEKSHQWAKQVYRLLEVDGAIAHHESTTGHGYQDDKQELLYEAVERWLAPPKPQGKRVLPARIESVDELRCGLPADNLTCRDVFQQWTADLPRAVPDPVPAEKQRAALRGLLGWPETLPAPVARELGREESGGWTATRWAVETEPGIQVPLLHVHGGNRNGSVVLLPGGNRDQVMKSLGSGKEVVVLAPRGTGEVSMPGSFRNWAWFVGRSLPGMHALDLTQVAKFCRDRLGAQSVTVDAKMDFGLAALLAGAAAPDQLEGGEVVTAVDSFRTVLEEQGDAALAEVPGLFERFDLPQLAALWPGGNVAVRQISPRTQDP